MFGTKLGASAENAMDLYLRPETAQGIFVNFLNVQKLLVINCLSGIAQIGKAFRNEDCCETIYLQNENLNKWKCNFSFHQEQIEILRRMETKTSELAFSTWFRTRKL